MDRPDRRRPGPCVISPEKCYREMLFSQIVQSLLEAVGMRALSLCQCFKPVGDFIKTFFPRGLGHARIHVGVFMSFTGDGCIQIVPAMSR